jgi:hypothetical protein
VLDLHAQGLAGTNQMLLAAQLFQAARAHPLGQGRGAQRALGAFRFAVKEAHCVILMNKAD